MAHASVLTADADNISDTRYPDGSGADIWDTIRSVVVEPKTAESVVTITVLLIWETLVRSGNDPYLQYRIVREVGGVVSELVGAETLSEADEDSVATRFSFPLIDTPGTLEDVTYELQARGVGYTVTTDSTYWVSGHTETFSGSASGSGATQGAALVAMGSAIPSGSDTFCNVYSESCSGDDDSGWSCSVPYTCERDIPGYWAGSVSTSYRSSTGHVKLLKATALYAREGIDAIVDEEE